MKLYHFYFFFLVKPGCVLSELVHTWKTSLSYTTSGLIPIRVGIDYKDGKTLPYNTITFSGLKLETFN